MEATVMPATAPVQKQQGLNQVVINKVRRMIDLSGHTRGILQFKAESILGNYTEKGTTQGYKEVSAEARFLGTVFSFDTYRSSQDESQRQAKSQVYIGCIHIIPFF